jgi:alkanesulfonate monooxygenase SsuD/methylene tetrahydromethanopterin reductase-like flavin-dependent oxidoreductase (luciferase family)
MPALKFGVALPYGSARAAAQLSQLAEQAGWDGCFVGDAIWCEDPMIALAAAAMTTQRIRLGTMVVPVPLRRPWKLASVSLALDRLSDGRLILGLGTGAVWMGWQGFPDEVTDTRARAEMLDETVDILTLLYQRRQVDYAGKHYHLKLTLVDEQYYPPKPVQQPRIPLWAVGAWPRPKSMRRVLKCDGLLAEKMNPEGQAEAVTPADIQAMKAYVEANRTLTTPFDIVVGGSTAGLERGQIQEKFLAWREAGVTWWVEGLWGEPEEEAAARIRCGPPQLG